MPQSSCGGGRESDAGLEFITCGEANCGLILAMSFENLKTELQSLSADARRKVVAFLVALDDQNHPGYAEKLARTIDDKSPEKWLTADECERRLGIPGKTQ
jgi:hypothetical protein